MKTIKLLFSLIIVIIANSFLYGQKSEGQLKTIPLIRTNITSLDAINAKDFFLQEQSETVVSMIAAAPNCSERERRIRHMLIDIECDSITPEELGFDCDDCIDLGDHVAFILRFVFPTSSNGGRTVWLDPLTAVTPGNQRRTHFIGWIPDSIISRIPLGAEFRMKYCE